MKRPRDRVNTILALLCMILPGCTTRATNRAGTHFEESTPPAVFREGTLGDSAQPPALAVSSILPGECPAVLGDYPVPYFQDQVLIRLPAGVTEDNFIEFAPSFARLSTEVESVNCVEGMPGAMINFMALVQMADAPNSSLEDIRDEALEAFGYPDRSTLVEQDYDPRASPRTGMWVYEVPPDAGSGKPEPAKILISMTAMHGQIVTIVFEVHPNAWSVMVNTFVEVVLRMSYLPGA